MTARYSPVEKKSDSRCDADPSRVALWWHTKTLTKLSGAAALHLVELRTIDIDDLVPHRAREYDTTLSNTEPVLGSAQGLLGLLTYSAKSFGQIFTQPVCGPSPRDLLFPHCTGTDC
jgi:hypothetical protein